MSQKLAETDYSGSINLNRESTTTGKSIANLVYSTNSKVDSGQPQFPSLAQATF